MTSRIEKVELIYKHKKAIGRKITVVSHIPIDIDTAWAKVQTSELLNFVAKGKVTFKPAGGHFPETWQEGSTVSTKMLIYGFIPFGGLHNLFVEKIDSSNKIIQTKEWDNIVKIWNHKISMKKTELNKIVYKDEIIIYAGLLTGFVTWWAKSFYKHRQKRWLIIAKNVINEHKL